MVHGAWPVAHGQAYTSLTRSVFRARQLVQSFPRTRKQPPGVRQAHCCVFRPNLPVLEGGSQELEHIQGASEVPSPVGRRGARNSTRNEGEEQGAVGLWGNTGGGEIAARSRVDLQQRQDLGLIYSRRSPDLQDDRVILINVLPSGFAELIAKRVAA